MSEITIEELKQRKIWLLWNYMPRKNGKMTQVPFWAYGGTTGTNKKYKDTLATYNEACAAMQKCGASGLGFKVSEDVYFLDSDHREMSDPLLQKLLSRRNSYKFVHDDNVYCKYYEVFYILFHTGLRISEFCGLIIKDLGMKNRIINIDHQLQRLNSMEYHIESTKTNAETRKIPMTEEVYRMFQAILEDRPTDLPEIMVNGYVGFLFRDKNGMPEVALHWEHRFKHAVNQYNSIF